MGCRAEFHALADRGNGGRVYTIWEGQVFLISPPHHQPLAMEIVGSQMTPARCQCRTDTVPARRQRLVERLQRSGRCTQPRLLRRCNNVSSAVINTVPAASAVAA